jgi:ATP-binding cassette subfamily B protein/subfamily B ATP-binding cassette protein MsbA
MRELKRIFVYCRQYPWYALGTLLCAVLSTLAGMAFPLLTWQIIDTVFDNGNPSDLAWMAGILFGTFFFRDFLNGLRIQLNNFFEQLVVFDLRSELYEKLQRLPLGWYHHESSGDLMTRVVEDVTQMERVLIDGIEQGSVALLQVLGVGFFLFWINAELALWAMAPMPLLIAGAMIYTTTAHKRYRIVRKATSAMNSYLLDNLQGILQIKSFGREERELAQFRDKASKLREATLVVIKAWSIYSPAMSFFGALGIVLVLFFGGRIALADPSVLSVGQLTAFVLYVGMFYDPVNRLHQLNQLVQGGRAAAERVFKILDTEEEYEPTQSKTLPPIHGSARSVTFEQVSFGYDRDRPVLHDIQLQAMAGQTIALVGPTGAGKSTLVGLVTRFHRATGGRILMDGVPIDELSLEELRKQVGIVSQEAYLFNTTVRENLLYGNPGADEAQMEAALRAANAWELTQNLPEKLDTNVGEKGVKLSVGEKQRLSIARALLKNPPVLILDEATASVDTATERLIQEALDYLLQNRTSFVIAHRLSTVRRADLICVLQNGRIIERGKHEELLARGGLYARLCEAQGTSETIEQVFTHLEN